MSQIAYRDYDIQVAAGAEETLDVSGRFVHCITTDLTSFRLGLDDEATAYFKQGWRVQKSQGDEPFKRIRIKNTDGANPLNLKLGIGYGEVSDQGISISGTINANVTNTELTTEEKSADTFTDYADQAITTAVKTTVLAANTDRVKAIIQNLESVGGTSIRVGGANTGASRGILVEPGQAIELETTALISVYHAKGSDLDIAVAEIERS